MKVTVLMVTVVIVAVTSEAFVDPNTIITLKTQIGDNLVNKVSAFIQAKQNLILTGTRAVLSAKQNLIQRQLPHLVAFKAEKINSLLQLKKNLLSTTAAQLGQIHISSGGGKDSEESSGPGSVGPPPAPPALPEAPAAPYGPSPVAPPTSYGPPPANPVRPTQYIKPVASAPAPPSTCAACSQSNSGPVTFSPYRPGAHVQPAPPPRPQGTYGPPSRPQGAYGPPPRPQPNYGPPASPPPPSQAYGLPANHKPASTYGPPARH